MHFGFWKKLKKPILALAPMADVTDAAFRQMLVRHGKPDVMFTEFVSAAGLCSVGKKALMQTLRLSEQERPLVMQVFGAQPEHFYVCAQLAQELGFDGIDINMGCPEKSIQKQGGGAALMLEPKRAQEIIRQAKRGAGKLPVSVKTRIGYHHNGLSEWARYLFEAEPAVITIHLRTKKEMSKAPAHWELMEEALSVRSRLAARTLLLGNGDVKNLQDAEDKALRYGVDGVMIGRGVFGNPWFFNRSYGFPPSADRGRMKEGDCVVSLEDRLAALVEHAKLFEKLFKKTKSFNLMKKHFHAYARDFDGAKELRMELMKAHCAEEAERVARAWLEKRGLSLGKHCSGH